MIPADGSAIRTIGTGFKAPVNVAADEAGNLFVDDAGNGVVKQIFPDGTIVNLPSGYSFSTGIVTDPAGNTYELDETNGLVKRLTVPAIPLGTLIDQNHPISVTHRLEGLTNGATYRYRLVSRNGDGFAVGKMLSFVAGQQILSQNDSYAVGGGAGNFLTEESLRLHLPQWSTRDAMRSQFAGPSGSLSGYPAIGFIYDATSSRTLDLTMDSQQIEFPEISASAVSDMTSADFNGDGAPDIAITGEFLTVIIANGNDYNTAPTT